MGAYHCRLVDMVGYIDLLDDSDDDIPLLPTINPLPVENPPSTKCLQPVASSPPTRKPLMSSDSNAPLRNFSTKTQPIRQEESIELLSSDDVFPVTSKSQAEDTVSPNSDIGIYAPVLDLTADSGSEKTEKYTDSTERYSSSSELESLPDLHGPDITSAADSFDNWPGASTGSSKASSHITKDYLDSHYDGVDPADQASSSGVQTNTVPGSTSRKYTSVKVSE